MKILFFGNLGTLQREGQVSPSSVIRVTNVARMLKKHGHECTIGYINKKNYELNKKLLMKSEVVVFHRIQASRRTLIEPTFISLYLLAKKHRKRVIFDFDDAIFLTFPLVCETCIKLADTVFAGSHYLLSYARIINRKTHLIPSSVDTEAFHPSRNNVTTNQIIIGWHGSAAGHFRNLKQIKPVLAKISQSYPITFRLLGSEDNQIIQNAFRMPGLKLDFGPTKWMPYTQLPLYLQDISIGISPLLDNIWNRGKCAMKVLEYMALAKPVVASSVGEHRNLIKDGVNGFLAGNTEEWVSKLSELIRNTELRQRVGEEAERTVISLFSLRMITAKINNLLTDN